MRNVPVITAVAIAGFACAAQAQSSAVTPSAIEAYGKGVQIYTCMSANGQYAWRLKAPDASLTDASGKPIGKHFAGPTWQATDGSTVVGSPLNVSSSPDAGAVPWLVLQAKSHGGKGLMSNVDYVVRTRTEGGVAPTSGCDADHAGAGVRVPYSAIYLFFRH